MFTSNVFLATNVSIIFERKQLQNKKCFEISALVTRH